LECLLTVLSGIVLRDRFLVEEKHIEEDDGEDARHGLTPIYA